MTRLHALKGLKSATERLQEQGEERNLVRSASDERLGTRLGKLQASLGPRTAQSLRFHTTQLKS